MLPFEDCVMIKTEAEAEMMIEKILSERSIEDFTKNLDRLDVLSILLSLRNVPMHKFTFPKKHCLIEPMTEKLTSDNVTTIFRDEAAVLEIPPGIKATRFGLGYILANLTARAGNRIFCFNINTCKIQEHHEDSVIKKYAEDIIHLTKRKPKIFERRCLLFPTCTEKNMYYTFIIHPKNILTNYKGRARGKSFIYIYSTNPNGDDFQETVVPNIRTVMKVFAEHENKSVSWDKIVSMYSPVLSDRAMEPFKMLDITKNIFKHVTRSKGINEFIKVLNTPSEIIKPDKDVEMTMMLIKISLDTAIKKGPSNVGRFMRALQNHRSEIDQLELFEEQERQERAERQRRKRAMMDDTEQFPK